MKQLILLIAIFVLNVSFYTDTNFVTAQKKYQRVRAAIDEKQNFIEEKLFEKNLTLDNYNLLLIAYKKEGILQLYAKAKTDAAYKKLIEYPICQKSGNLGPKRKRGDYQVPEGFYFIDRYNPASNFYLSLGINYPNQADKLKSTAQNLGGDIFIHGSCVTIGCIPMTDDFIKEIYLFAIYAKNNEQNNIPVYIFPCKMTDENMINLKQKYNHKPTIIQFWKNLKIGYDKFIKNKQALNILINNNGDYMYK